MFESLNEPVDVLSVFLDGSFEPLRFRWKGKVIRVRRVTGRWSRRVGQSLMRYFSIESDGSGTFELYYDPRGPKWMLSRAWTPSA